MSARPVMRSSRMPHRRPEVGVPSSTPVVPKREPRKRALLVGINYKNGLTGPHRDAQDMKTLLIEKYGYQPDNITMLVDDMDERKGAFQPTKDNLLRELHALLSDSHEGDYFFFYYAGHVVQGPVDRSSKEEDNREEYVVPCDADMDSENYEDFIQDDKLRELLVDPLPVGASLVAVFDSCHSATLLDLEHYRCNRVYVPWISKGKRRSDRLWNNVQRRGAAALSLRSITQSTRLSSDKVQSLKTSVGQLHIDTNVLSSPSDLNRDTHALYSPPGTPKLLTPLKTAATEPLTPTTSNTPTLSKSKTLKPSFTFSPSATFNSVSSKIRKQTKNTGDNMPAPITKKKRTSTTDGSAYKRWLTGDLKLKTAVAERQVEEDKERSSGEFVQSPVADYCSGECKHPHRDYFSIGSGDEKRKGSYRVGGEVVALSACRDSQLTWEDKDGNSMTQILIRELRKQTHPSYRHLMANISFELHKAAVNMHKDAKKFKEDCVNYRSKKGNDGTSPTERESDTNGLELANFQNPELSSRVPLDMDKHFMK
ncbi:hypothetical protein VKT23_014098 [Stygiomarasmius scandens]|uniref:Peptidase C14 caspase domain-containing protein n=1 Tax=Marasmiellus scandens TaxID=2682957 RepID=A0ABR1J4M4_9AGAR